MQNLLSTTALTHFRSTFARPLEKASSILGNQDGGIAMAMGLLVVPLALLLGLAVDGGLAYSARSKLQGAADSAVLAGAQAASVEGSDVLADAKKYFDANYPEEFIGGQLTTFESTFNDESRELTVNAEAEIPTAFMRVAGFETMSVAVRSTAQQQLSGIELALVLDVTGSMNRADPSGGTKINSLKTAANSLLDIIYGENDTIDDVAVSVIPYNTTINLGSDRTGFLTGFDADSFGADGWKGCVEARDGGNDLDDTPPSEEAFTALLWPVDDRNNRESDPNKGCLDSEVLPLTSEKSVVSEHIDDLEADGFTMTNVGFTWGWRTISPRWQGEWGTNGVPVAYDHPTIKKAIIFMTDGIAVVPQGRYTAYGFLREGRLGSQNRRRAAGEINDRLLETCELAKAEEIEVYTVMFALDDASVERDYRACATSDDHFFDAPDGDELEAAFNEIAGQLTSLRLTQ